MSDGDDCTELLMSVMDGVDWIGREFEITIVLTDLYWERRERGIVGTSSPDGLRLRISAAGKVSINLSRIDLSRIKQK